MAAFNVQAMLNDEQNADDLKPLLPQLLMAYLKLMKEIDHDDLVNALTVPPGLAAADWRARRWSRRIMRRLRRSLLT